MIYVQLRRKSIKWLAITLSLFMLLNVFSGTGLIQSNIAYALDPNIAINKTASADSGNSTASTGNDDSIYTTWRADDGNNNHWWKVD